MRVSVRQHTACTRWSSSSLLGNQRAAVPAAHAHANFNLPACGTPAWPAPPGAQLGRSTGAPPAAPAAGDVAGCRGRARLRFFRQRDNDQFLMGSEGILAANLLNRSVPFAVVFAAVSFAWLRVDLVSV